MKFSIETIVGDRYHATDSLTKTEVHDWLLNLEKNDILKIQTSDEYWEDIPEQLFELIKTGIKAKNTGKGRSRINISPSKKKSWY